MKTPRNYTQAKHMNYITYNLYEGVKQIRVDMKPRFGRGKIVSFWLTYSGAKRLGINIY